MALDRLVFGVVKADAALEVLGSRTVVVFAHLFDERQDLLHPGTGAVLIPD